jgi:CheY-like chemotaxis protein
MLKILLVDDDPEEYELLQSGCKDIDQDVIVIHADGCDNLLHEVIKHKPDIVFLDINMPGINGIECLKSVRANKQFKSLPVIMYSTSNSPSSIQESYQNEANLYIIKPQSIKGIVNALEKVLEIDWNLQPKMSLNEFVIA